MNSLARRRRSLDIWPGFVDALSSLILVMVFVLLLFAIGQFVLSQTIVGKNQALAQLNAQIAQLAKTLSLAQDSNLALDSKVKELSVSLGSTTGERDTLKTQLDASTVQAAKLTADIAALSALKQQLDETYRRRQEEYEEILALTNPAVRKKLLESFADGTDSASVHLKAAALPRQRTQVREDAASLR